jgi:prophage regulatory protein
MNHVDEVVVRMPEVMRRVGLSKSSIYAMVTAKSFPAPIPIGPRARGWLISEISSWLSQRVAAREKQARREAS